MLAPHPALLRIQVILACAVLLHGCSHPLQRQAEQDMHEQLIASNRAYLQAVAPGPVVELGRAPSEVEAELTDERRAELDKMSGPNAYQGQPLPLGADLMSQTNTQTVAMTLHDAIHLAAKNNLQVQFAQFQPTINRAQLDQAHAAFDAVFFSNFNFNKLDTPQPSSLPGLDAFGSVQSDNRKLDTGIRKTLTTGGQITASTSFGRNSRDPSFFAVETFYETDVMVSLTQPILRNFGTDVNKAQIHLTQNAQQQAVQDLRLQIITTTLETEQAYWSLVFARQRLLIQQRLLERTQADRNQLKQRQNFDVNPVRLTEANSFVELRRADVIRARQQVGLASDQLKRLINSPDLPVAGETLILPVDTAADLPLKYSLIDAVTTALRYRPELQQAVSQIDDASIRQRVADNQRLPQLDIAATASFNSIGDDVGDSYSNLGDGEFIDYIVTAQFEVPIGNRGPEALYHEQKLARHAAVINYQRLAQEVVLDVKDALRNLYTTYQLIGATRAARRAASDNLRALEEQEDAGVALTPEFLLDLKLSTQERLANAEVQEIQALTDYNTAISNFYRAMGTLLQRNGIDIANPAAN